MRKFVLLFLCLCVLFTAPAMAQDSELAQSTTTSGGASDREALFWESIRDSNNPAYFQAYLAQFPEGTFAAIARIKLKELGAPESVGRKKEPNEGGASPSVIPVDGQWKGEIESTSGGRCIEYSLYGRLEGDVMHVSATETTATNGTGGFDELRVTATIGQTGEITGQSRLLQIDGRYEDPRFEGNAMYRAQQAGRCRGIWWLERQ